MTSFWLLHADADLMSDVATLAGFVTGAFFVLELSVTSAGQPAFWQVLSRWMVTSWLRLACFETDRARRRVFEKLR